MELFVFFLDVTAVLEHDFRDVLRRIRAENSALVAFFVQERNSARVIHVSVRQHHRVDPRLGIKREALVLGGGFAALALKHATVEKDRDVPHLDFMAGASDFSCRSVGNEFDVHMSLFLIISQLTVEVSFFRLR